MTGTVGTLARHQLAAALGSARGCDNRKRVVTMLMGDPVEQCLPLTSSSSFSVILLSGLPVLKAIKEQISSQREGR